MKSLHDLVGKRALLSLSTSRYGGANIDEYRVLELSPSGNWVKLMNLHGLKFWKPVTALSFVEELIDLSSERAPNRELPTQEQQ